MNTVHYIVALVLIVLLIVSLTGVFQMALDEGKKASGNFSDRHENELENNQDTLDSGFNGGGRESDLQSTKQLSQVSL